MSSWKDAASQYDKEHVDKQQRINEHLARKERGEAKNLEEVSKADRLVMDFLKAAKSAGNPGIKTAYEFHKGFLGSRKRKAIGRYWANIPGMNINGYIDYYTALNSEFSQALYSYGGALVVREHGTWSYKNHAKDRVYDIDHPNDFHDCFVGRGREGLFVGKLMKNPASEIATLQRILLRLMRENEIPLPD